MSFIENSNINTNKYKTELRKILANYLLYNVYKSYLVYTKIYLE